MAGGAQGPNAGKDGTFMSAATSKSGTGYQLMS